MCWIWAMSWRTDCGVDFVFIGGNICLTHILWQQKRAEIDSLKNSVSHPDAAGWRPSQEDIDRYGRRIPDVLYGTADFERKVALLKRTEAIAKHLTDFLKKTDRFAKTIVFCVDQEHASEMRTALNNLNKDMVQQASSPASSGGVSPPGPTPVGTTVNSQPGRLRYMAIPITSAASPPTKAT